MNGEYHYITVLGHPSNQAPVAALISALPYHYITVLGHPSNLDSNGNVVEISTITLQFWGILPTARRKKRAKK